MRLPNKDNILMLYNQGLPQVLRAESTGLSPSYISKVVRAVNGGSKSDKMKRRSAGHYLDLEIIKNLCKIQSTGEEIAGVLGVDYETLNRALISREGMTFKEFFKMHSAVGKVSLRRMQFKTALDEERPSIALLIWLGKQYLGQKESILTVVDSPPLAPLGVGIACRDAS